MAIARPLFCPRRGWGWVGLRGNVLSEIPRGRNAGLRPAYGLVEAGTATLHRNTTRAEGFQPQSRSQTGAPSIPQPSRLGISELKPKLINSKETEFIA